MEQQHIVINESAAPRFILRPLPHGESERVLWLGRTPVILTDQWAN